MENAELVKNQEFLKINQLRQIFDAVATTRKGSTTSQTQLRDFLNSISGISSAFTKATPATTLDPQTDLTSLRDFLSKFEECNARRSLSAQQTYVWQLLQVGNLEVRNTAALAWLFDSNASHGYGREILTHFLSSIEARGHKRIQKLSGIVLPSIYSVIAESAYTDINSDRIDVEIFGPDLRIFIEAKINAPEGKNQFARYEARLQDSPHAQKRLIILTRSTSRKALEDDQLLNATWRDVGLAITSALGTRRTFYPKTFNEHLLSQFADHVRQL